MISIEDEKQIRVLLKSGKFGPEIAKLTGISTDVVYAIRKMVSVVAELSSQQRSKIKILIQDGLPLTIIETRMHLSRYVIHAVRRYYYLHPSQFQPDESIKCPQCSSIKIMDEKYTGKRLSIKEIWRSTDRMSVVAMYRVIEDLAAMGSCNLPLVPLLNSLTVNAKKIVEKIHGKSSGDR